MAPFFSRLYAFFQGGHVVQQHPTLALGAHYIQDRINKLAPTMFRWTATRLHEWYEYFHSLSLKSVEISLPLLQRQFYQLLRQPLNINRNNNTIVAPCAIMKLFLNDVFIYVCSSVSCAPIVSQYSGELFLVPIAT